MTTILKRFAFVLLGVALIGATARDVHAGMVTFTFKGVVDEVFPSLAGVFAVGDQLTGTYQYPTDWPADPSSDSFGSRFSPADAYATLTFTIGSHTFSDNGSAATDIIVDNPDPVFGVPDVVTYQTTIFYDAGVLPPEDPANPFGLRIVLSDSTNGAISTALNLPTGLQFSDFDSATFVANFGHAPVSGHLTDISFQVSEVPEPSSLLLGTLGVCGVVLARNRRRKSIVERPVAY
jgi:hypothetical protein